jgi:hypothetical protein
MIPHCNSAIVCSFGELLGDEGRASWRQDLGTNAVVVMWLSVISMGGSVGGCSRWYEHPPLTVARRPRKRGGVLSSGPRDHWSQDHAAINLKALPLRNRLNRPRCRAGEFVPNDRLADHPSTVRAVHRRARKTFLWNSLTRAVSGLGASAAASAAAGRKPPSADRHPAHGPAGVPRIHGRVDCQRPNQPFPAGTSAPARTGDLLIHNQAL